MTVKLSAENLTLIRGERCLFRELTFALNDGELLLLEGANGSGKTSLIRSIAGLLSLESGTLHWDGQPALQHAAEFRRATVWLGHKTGLKSDLSLLDNLQFERSLRPQSAVSIDEACERVGLSTLKRLPIRSMSAGQQRRAALARVLLADAALWLLDEPFTNLDVAGRDLVCEVTEQHLKAGGLCVMAAHQAVDINAETRRIAL